jgi:pimeloyl-ACP methyl ester carboxylesterase
MPLIHHVVSGTGNPPLVLVHGFSCDHTDWAAQVEALSPRHRTVAVDLRGHGRSPATGAECSIEAYAADVAAVMRSLDLAPSVIVGHSMGCRVAVEAALQVPERTAGVVLIDGSQFTTATDVLVRRRIAAGELDAMIQELFEQMFNQKSDKARAAGIVARAARFARDVALQMTLDSIRYDTTRLEASLAALSRPLMVMQTTYTNAQRQRVQLAKGETMPYFETVRRLVAGARIEIIPETGHFPQIDAPAETNTLLADFMRGLPKGA